ncbi:MAG: cobyric acid synthase, partial [Candidatus Latescibacteria bacterium]|nr:cobyric acid synthase [Candidatus Latescibacterota bacterium]
MATGLMLLGTHSNAGKSLMVTAFCRLFARQGYRVAPFKAQNMSNNAGVTPEGGEMGRAQLVQAEAAGILPHTDMNPVLLKPQADHRSQVVLNGKVYGHLEAENWRQIKQKLWGEVKAAYDRLADRYDVIVLEGAGSPAEINLKDGDIVNLRMARYANAPCLLVGDIDRGGVFAALAGTMLLLEPEERVQIKAFLINKFRGDVTLLGSVLDDFRERAFGVSTLGVVPFLPNLNIADEDAVVLDQAFATGENAQVDIAVIHVPHISNFDDFDPLKYTANVAVRFVRDVANFGKPDAIILPGTKATLSDLAWMQKQGWDVAISEARQAGVQVIGICGGYQMLGRKLTDTLRVESTSPTSADGLGLLSIETRFVPAKQTHQVCLTRTDGFILQGYEIHAGDTKLDEDVEPFGVITRRGGQAVQISDGAVSADKKVWG